MMKKAIEVKEHDDIMAVLTDAQKKEVADIVLKDKTAAKTKAKATTKPAAAPK